MSPARWVSNRDRARATLALAKSLPADVTAVAGVGRSGIASALQIAELLHLHAFAISRSGELTKLPHGARFDDAPPDDGRLAIVDDTVAGGASFGRLRAATLGRDALFAATYVTPEGLHLVDLYGEVLPMPHYLEWNYANSHYVQMSAFDFDGVLCDDCPPGDDDDGPRYARFLRTATPWLIPRRFTIPAIVTARLERYRPQTEEWLARHRIQCDELIMGFWRSAANRATDDVARWKAWHYAHSLHRCELFVESCPHQARRIAELAGKRVLCPTTGEVHL